MDIRDGERIIPADASSPYERLQHRRHLFAYRLAASRARGLRVLEAGFGDGYGSAVLAGAGAAAVEAVDNNSAAVSHASSLYHAANLNYGLYDGRSLPFPDGSFDLAVAFQVIEHVEAPAAFLAELRRVLKPGGACLLTTPNRVHRLKPGQKPWYKFHRREYTRGELLAEVSAVFPGASVEFIQAPPELYEMELRVARVATLAQSLRLPDWLLGALQGVKKLVFRSVGSEPSSEGPFAVTAADERGLDLFASASRK